MKDRVAGLDTLRFVLATWVMVGHVGRLPYAELIQPAGAAAAARLVYNNLISGPAAVIAFFVISGFCIHFPYRNVDRLALIPYFARRHIRILTPVAVVLLLARLQGTSIHGLSDSILWSLVCEEIYYTIYPLLLRIHRRWSWPWMIAIAFLAALSVAATNPTAGNYPSYGWTLNWVLGLPCWLLGCHLAQGWDPNRAREEYVSRASMWAWRLGVWALSVVCSALRFHSVLTYPWTLNLFAFVVALWIEREIVYALCRPPVRWLEWAGGASYSIYLVHLLAIRLVRDLMPLQPDRLADWLLIGASTLALCYVFYRLVERPSHALARRAYSLLMDRLGPVTAVKPA